MEPGYQRNYASAAASRAARLGLSSAPPPGRSRQGSYATEGTQPSAMFHRYSTPSDKSPHYHHRDDDEDDAIHSPSGFTSDSDGGESSESEYLCDTRPTVLRSAYSEPVYPPLPSSHHTRQGVPRTEPTAPPPLLPAERHALLDRIRHLSTREAETAAALAQARSENAALADEVSHWRAVAKESANARRAARDALSEVSAENARLAAAYTAHRIESEALRETLEHERAHADARIRHLERSLGNATKEKTSFASHSSHAHRNSNFNSSRAFGADSNTYTNGPHGFGDPSNRGRGKSSGGGYDNNQQAAPPSDSAAWDNERQELLDLLERLQDQLGIHSGYSRPGSPSESNPSWIPNVSRSRRASPRRRAASSSGHQGAAAAPEHMHTSSAGGVVSSGEASPEKKHSPSTAPRMPSSTPPHSKFKVSPHASSAGTTPLQSPQCARTPPAVSAASTPTPQEPASVAYESSFESYKGDEIPQDTTTPAATPPSKFSTPVARGSQQSPFARDQTSTRQFPTVNVNGAPSPPPMRNLTPSDSKTPHSSSSPHAPSREHPAVALKREGDRLVQMKQYDAALESYTAALTATETSHKKDSQQYKSMIVSLLCARASVFTYTGRPMECAADCYRACLIDPSCVRALDVRAKAFFLMGAFDHAAEDLSTLRGILAPSEWQRTPALQSRLQEAKQRAAADAPRNHYAVLGVKHSAVAGEIKASYRALALKIHPDKGGGVLGVESATALFSLLSAAHATLSTPQSRRAYDLELLRQKYVGTGPLSAGRQHAAGGAGGFNASSWASGWT